MNQFEGILCRIFNVGEQQVLIYRWVYQILANSNKLLIVYQINIVFVLYFLLAT